MPRSLSHLHGAQIASVPCGPVAAVALNTAWRRKRCAQRPLALAEGSGHLFGIFSCATLLNYCCCCAVCTCLLTLSSPIPTSSLPLSDVTKTTPSQVLESRYSGAEQALLLAWCTHVRKGTAHDELQASTRAVRSW